LSIIDPGHWEDRRLIHIRTSEPSDLSGLMRVERESFSMPWAEESVLSFLDDEAHRICFAATEDEEGVNVVGYLALQFVCDEAEICNIAVRPAFRGCGVGGMLIDRAVDFCARKAVNALHLEVRTHNTPAVKLYEKKGFRQVGLRRGYYEDSGEDALLFARPIDNIPAQ